MHFGVVYNAFTDINLFDFVDLEDFSRLISLFINWKGELLN